MSGSRLVEQGRQQPAPAGKQLCFVWSWNTPLQIVWELYLTVSSTHNKQRGGTLPICCGSLRQMWGRQSCRRARLWRAFFGQGGYRRRGRAMQTKLTRRNLLRSAAAGTLAVGGAAVKTSFPAVSTPLDLTVKKIDSTWV